MRKFLFLLPALLLSLSCAKTYKASPVAASKDYFSQAKGCFLLYNVKTKVFEKVINEDICRTQYPACSTFKVPLAVMAFDSGVLSDENEVLKWDGVKSILVAHNQDHNAKTWMKDSVVWFSQRLTPELGEKKVQSYLNKFDYGNKDLSAGIKQAWLVPPIEGKAALKISAYEQLEFLKKLWSDSLSASKNAMQLTREITYLETSPKGFKLNGKTGSNFYDKDHKIHFGWFIAHLEKGSEEYIAVTNLSDLTASTATNYGGPRAKLLTKEILADFGLW